MKNKKSILLFLLFLIIPTSIYSISQKQLLSGITIVLDAGHGGMDQGAEVHKVYEAPLNLQIVNKLKIQLEILGCQVVLTRVDENDLSNENSTNKKREDLKNRIQIINDEKNDLMISIHMNLFQEESVQGIHVFYQKKESSSYEIAQTIQQQFNQEMNQVKQSKLGIYYLLENARIPSILIECGFLSNEIDRMNLQDEHYQEKLVSCIVKGILEYYDSKEYI